MPKKSGVNISMIMVIRIIVFLVIGFVLFSLYTNSADFLTTSPLFDIKEVLVDSSIQFIDMRRLKQLKGQNIFQVDINRLSRHIAAEYPYVAGLRVVRRFPDHLLVLAKKRTPLLQIPLNGKFLTVDTKGVALFYTPQPLKLPQLHGIGINTDAVVLGAPLSGKGLDKAVTILDMFRQDHYLSRWRVSSIDAGNLSRIDLTIEDSVHVIVDSDHTENKIEMLQMLAAGHKIDLSRIKYIDVRFKEPVIGSADTGID